MAKQVTDWDSYYSRPFKSAAVTRRYTAARIRRTLQLYATTDKPRIAELGGGDSAFFEVIDAVLRPSFYGIIDNNRTGLDAFASRIGSRDHVELIEADILHSATLPRQLDLVYSVGLVEHFPQPLTARILATHFELLKPGGIALVTFPTPTALYRLTRFIAEITSNWIFHDQRPLDFEEVRDTVSKHGTILHEEILWPILLTQGLMVCRKEA